MTSKQVTYLKKIINKESFLREFVNEIWNKKRFDKVEQYVHTKYTIHLDNSDPWEGKTFSHSAFRERLKFSFNSFPDINFEITSAISEENHAAITWILKGTNLSNIGDNPTTNKEIITRGMTISFQGQFN